MQRPERATCGQELRIAQGPWAAGGAEEGLSGSEVAITENVDGHCRILTSDDFREEWCQGPF